MRRRFRILAVLLILSLTTALLPAPAMAAETENTGSDFDLLAEIKAANNGDTIQIPMGAVVKNGATDARPLFIEKSVTIQGGSITLWAGGIMLGADVTFKDTSLIFATNSRNAIIANGHTLILDNVSAGQYSFNLFCGGLLRADFETFDVPDPGPVGTIIIKGNTNLQSKNEYGSGDIYAGNLCMGGMNANQNGPDDNGPANDFAGDAVIKIEGAASSTALGDIYACGAQQRIPVNATSGKITLSDPDKYTISGTVSVSGKTPNVYGAGGASAVDVAFGNDGNQASLTMTGISHLTVDSGDLALRHGSGFENLTLSSGAKLNLSDMGNCDTGDLDSGGGILVLGQNQTFTIRGAVSGDTTQLAIGGVNSSNGSTAKPAALHTYIQAPGSNDTSFRLLPSGAGDPEFSRDEMGNWTTGEEPVLVKSFAFLTAAASIDTAGNMAELDLVVEGLDYLDFTPLEIYVNDVLAVRNDELDEYGGFYYTYTSEFSDELIDISANTLYFAPKENGTYTIKITVPAVHTVNGQPLSSTAVLTVGAENPPPGHTHDWDATWAASGTHHWHNCIVADCPTTDDSQKNGYAAHTAGGWIVDQQPTASVPGSRYKACTVCGYETDREEIPATGGETPGHTHVWAAQWSSDKTHHWHNCTAEGCTAALEQLNGYAAHTAGGWIVDQQPTVSVPGSRYKTCTVCGYETDREEIPATGGETPGHTHVWAAQWSSDKTHHWHNCTTEGCTAALDQLSGYAAHTAGDWIIDRNPTASLPGSRYKACTVCGYEMDREEIPVTGGGENPGHTHVWDTRWSTDKTHHWHNCTAEGCTAALDQLSGYAAHTAGDWIIDQQPTASNPGSRHRVCTVCGYEMDRESVPATGGSSGSNRPSRPSSSSSSSTSTTTQRNPDGSSTTTQTNHVTGTVTETVRNPDGSQTVVETRKDGTVTSTEKTANGSTVKTVEAPDGSREITVQQSNGVTAQVSVDRWGTAEAEVKLTAKSISQSGATPLPIPDLPVTKAGSAQVTVHTGSTKPVKVEIPVTNPTPGTVAVIVNSDGSETVVKSSLLTGAGLTAAVSDGAVVKIVDNSKAFPDTASHWARDAVDFVSARQLFSGRSASAFAPNDTMTRAMLITAVARLDGVDTSGGASWYERSMAWAVQQGVSDGSSPGGQITREQLVTVLYRYAGSPAASAQMPFSDTNAISGYAYDAMRWAVENDILSGYGDGTLAPRAQAPRAQATRAQAAMMLMRYMNFCGES